MPAITKTVIKTQNGAANGGYGNAKATGIELWNCVSLCHV